MPALGKESNIKQFFMFLSAYSHVQLDPIVLSPLVIPRTVDKEDASSTRSERKATSQGEFTYVLARNLSLPYQIL